MIDLQRSVIEDFAEAQRLARRDPIVRRDCDTDDDRPDYERLSFATRRRSERPLTKLEVAFLVELRRDPRVARAAAALKLGSTVARKTAVRLSKQRLIRLEHLKNKRRTLVARFVSGGFYE